MVACDHYPVATVTVGDWGDDFPAVRLTSTNPLDAKVEAYMEQYTYGTVSEELAMANARLIAAAPEMYDYIAAQAKRGDRKAKKIIFALSRAPLPRTKNRMAKSIAAITSGI